MTKRINVILPQATLQAIDRLTSPGQRSRFIDRAVQHYVATQSAEAVQKRLEAAVLRDRDLDEAITEEWAAVDQDTWQQPDQPATRGAANSTSRRSTRR